MAVQAQRNSDAVLAIASKASTDAERLLRVDAEQARLASLAAWSAGAFRDHAVRSLLATGSPSKNVLAWLGTGPETASALLATSVARQDEIDAVMRFQREQAAALTSLGADQQAWVHHLTGDFSQTALHIEAAMAHYAQNEAASAAVQRLAGQWAQDTLLRPEASAIARMAQEAALAVDGHRWRIKDAGAWGDDLAIRMASIAAPWASSENLGVSALGFGELSVLRDVVAFEAPFARQTVRTIRDQLGDAVADLGDQAPDVREASRQAAGRNSALVAFPAESYGEVVVAAGFRLFVPPPPQLSAEDDTATIFDPSHNALLTSLEQHARRFVADQLSAIEGGQWIKRRVSEAVRKRWVDRRDRAVVDGQRTFPLEHYADFGDLADVIGQKNNWDEVFKAVFGGDKASMQLSFQRLLPIRNHLAHSRPLTPGDVIELACECARLFKALGKDLYRT